MNRGGYILINEACNLTTLTKKAISYYEKHGLIEPRKCSNGYREYSRADIALLDNNKDEITLKSLLRE